MNFLEAILPRTDRKIGTFFPGSQVADYGLDKLKGAMKGGGAGGAIALPAQRPGSVSGASAAGQVPQQAPTDTAMNPQKVAALGQIMQQMQQGQQHQMLPVGQLAQPRGIQQQTPAVDPMAQRQLIIAEMMRRMPMAFQQQGGMYGH